MRKRNKLLLSLAAASLTWLAGTGAQAQSYSNAVMALGPAAYWPLAETTQPSLPMNITAANSGSLGAAGNGYYGAWYQPSGVSYYLTNNVTLTNSTVDSGHALYCAQQAGQYVIVPRTIGGVANPATTITAPFSVEAWTYVGATNSANRIIVNEGMAPITFGGSDTNYPFSGGLGAGWAGFTLGQYQDYFYFMVNATNKFKPGNNELDTSGYNKWKGAKVGQWYHVVATFDGTNAVIYTNGVQAAAMAMPANAAGLRYVPDPTTPLTIGNRNVYDASQGGQSGTYAGALDEVAIYPSVLSAAQVSAHYSAASGSYSTTVLADNPSLYYRFEDSVAAASAGYDTNAFPVAVNYGSLSSAANGFYQPGTTPGVPGPSYAGFGASSKAVNFNGFLGAVDVGGGNLPAALNPTNTQPLTVATWFKANPADAPQRFQILLGHGDNSYRLALDQGPGSQGSYAAVGGNRFNPGSGPELQFTNLTDLANARCAFNDGKWHMVAGVSDGTNDYMYLDGQLVKSGSGVAGILGSTNDLTLGGDPVFSYPAANPANTLRNFNGSLAHVAYFTNALSAAQIQQLYNVAGVPPSIVQQPPASVKADAGTIFAASTLAQGSGPLAYQWYTSTGSAVSGQTNATLSFNPLAPGNAGSYYAVASNPYGTATSSIVALTVVSTPTLVQQSLTSIKVFTGTTPSLRATVAGPSLYYQWKRDGAIVGASTNTYTLSTSDTSAVGSHTYSCTITNVYGSVSLNNITVTVVPAPTANHPVTVLADKPAAFFRLNESDDGLGNNGLPAYDYAGGNNAAYTNTMLGQIGYSSSEPTETSAFFGGFPSTNPNNDYAGNVPTYLNFGTPNGGNAQFSVEAWINQADYKSTTGNGIVALGTGNGGEQFVLDTGASTSGNLRFFVRDAAGGTHGASSSKSVVNDGIWHHVVGVCDEAGGKVYLYLDGVQLASATITAGSGLLSSTVPMSIGARQSGNSSPANYDAQFLGLIDDVAVYNYALSAAQVQNHYYGGAPFITQIAPVTQDVNQGTTVSITATAGGTAPLGYQWSDPSGSPIAGATTNKLTLNNVQVSQTGFYTLTVINAFGSATTNAYLNVNQGPAVIAVDLQPLNQSVWANSLVTYYVVASGSPPFTYQWYKDGALMTGVTGPTNTFAALQGSHTYQCKVLNNYSAGVPASSSVATLVGMASTALTPANYTDKFKITFAGYNRSETLKDFPVLVRLSTKLSGFSYAHFASSKGADLRFTDASGTRLIPHEIDEWNPNGESTVWVQVPALSGPNDCIWAYWGNSSPDAALPTTNVWVPQTWEGLPAFDVVYHLKEGAFPFTDATGQYTTTNGLAPGQATGMVGTGAAFSSSLGTYLDLGPVATSNQFSVSAWVYTPTSIANEQTIWANKHGGWNADGWDLYFEGWYTVNGVMFFDTGDGVGGAVPSRTASGAVGLGQWHFLTGVLDGAAGVTRVYLDGVDVTINTSTQPSFQTTNNVRLGSLLGTGGQVVPDGIIDEARIQAGTNSPSWVWASYMTVVSNATWQSYGAISSTVPATVTPPTLSAIQVSGQNLILSGSGDATAIGKTYQVWSSTNLALSTSWKAVATNLFDSNGRFSVTNALDASKPQQFFRVVVPPQ